jgi:very-short-patch-repair endonuclease
MLPESDVVTINGFRTTSALRTVRDLGSGRDPVECVVAIDMAVRVGIIKMRDLVRHIETHPGEKGIKRLRLATALAEPRSESPMETRLRMALVRSGLPRPTVQADLHDRSGRFLGRADLYYPDRRLVVEYDGENHRERLVPDMRRQNALLNAGYHVLRFTAADLRTPASVVAQVGHALAHRLTTAG